MLKNKKYTHYKTGRIMKDGMEQAACKVRQSCIIYAMPAKIIIMTAYGRATTVPTIGRVLGVHTSIAKKQKCLVKILQCA